MPSPLSYRNAASSSSSKTPAEKSGRVSSPPVKLRRPRTVPDLISWERNASSTPAAAERLKLTKVLLNVTVQGSVGAVQVLMSPESTVLDLISATLKQYAREGRRPMLSGLSFADFDLHFSQFSLESLDREEKVSGLGCRNFFMCKRKAAAAIGDGGAPLTTCSEQAEMLRLSRPWLKFMSFLF